MRYFLNFFALAPGLFCMLICPCAAQATSCTPGLQALVTVIEARHLPLALALIAGGADVSTPDASGVVPLIAAARQLPDINAALVIQSLIANGANVKAIEPGTGNTLLHYIALSKIYTTYPALTDTIIAAAITEGIGIDTQNANGDTPLHLTMGSCQLLFAWDLINTYAASLTTTNLACQTPVDVAVVACKWQFFAQ